MHHRRPRSTPPGWNPISTAPLDGTPIELRNDYGIAPTYSLSARVDGAWRDVRDPIKGTMDGDHLSWRPYDGDPADYVDPTGGAQETSRYWLEAAGVPAREIDRIVTRHGDDPTSETPEAGPRRRWWWPFG